MNTKHRNMTFCSNSDETELEQGDVVPPYAVFTTTTTKVDTHVYISSDIGAPHQYTELIHALHSAQNTDTFHIHLNTGGGDLTTGAQLLTALQNTEAHVITYLEGIAYSLGSMLFLIGDEQVVSPFGQLMIHHFGGAVDGKGSEMVSRLAAACDWFALIARSVYLPFINEAELDSVIRGEDLWFQADEIVNRLRSATLATTPQSSEPDDE